MDYEMRQQKRVFTKEWPAECDPPMKAFDYFNRRFQGVDGYNWWLLPCVNDGGEPKYWGYCRNSAMTMKFLHNKDHTSMLRSDSWERIGVLVQSGETVYELYLDEEGYLFGNHTSETTVGYLSQARKMWDGTAELNVDALREHHEFAEVKSYNRMTLAK
jgi:hypothetical protein